MASPPSASFPLPENRQSTEPQLLATIYYTGLILRAPCCRPFVSELGLVLLFVGEIRKIGERRVIEQGATKSWQHDITYICVCDM